MLDGDDAEALEQASRPFAAPELEDRGAMTSSRSFEIA